MVHSDRIGAVVIITVVEELEILAQTGIVIFRYMLQYEKIQDVSQMTYDL